MNNTYSSVILDEQDDYPKVTQADLDRAKFRVGLKPAPRNGTTTVQEVQARRDAIFLDPDVAAYFPDSAAVNNALRTLINLVPKPRKRRVRKTPLAPAPKA
ncbi:MAG: hypothetical protein U0350_02380 [Caldilineaceae bacterium]